jgi:hypothetical protein
MDKDPPYHTNSLEYGHRHVHHDHDICPDGRRIKEQHRVDGTGGKPRCDVCIRLDDEKPLPNKDR